MAENTDILQMPAGKHMDAAIAEHVLGHVWVHNKRYGCLVASDEAEVVIAGGHASAGKHPEHDAGCWIGPLDRYSTDIAAAWLVVDKLTADGWGHKHLVLRAAAEYPGWQWTFMRPGGGRGAGIAGAEADTAALAICRAALQTPWPAPSPTLEKEKNA
jgi:hypothetical protein